MTNRTQYLQDPFLNALRKQKVPVNLYLTNGIRLQGQVSAFDMNALPISAIERVEVLKDGASSLLGILS